MAETDTVISNQTLAFNSIFAGIDYKNAMIIFSTGPELSFVSQMRLQTYKTYKKQHSNKIVGGCRLPCLRMLKTRAHYKQWELVSTSTSHSLYELTFGGNLRQPYKVAEQGCHQAEFKAKFVLGHEQQANLAKLRL